MLGGAEEVGEGAEDKDKSPRGEVARPEARSSLCGLEDGTVLDGGIRTSHGVGVAGH